MKNCSVADHPKAKLDASVVGAVHAVYAITSVSALIGNSLVIVVYSRSKRSNKLKMFLLNLALADIFNGVFCIPFTYTEYIYGTCVVPDWMCHMAQVVLYLSVWVSAVTLTAISVERSVYHFGSHSLMYEQLRSTSYALLESQRSDDKSLEFGISDHLDVWSRLLDHRLFRHSSGHKRVAQRDERHL